VARSTVFIVALAACAWLNSRSSSFSCWLLFRQAAQKMGLLCCSHRIAQKSSRWRFTFEHIIVHIYEAAGQHAIPYFFHNCL